jgi:hypothetical protein
MVKSLDVFKYLTTYKVFSKKIYKYDEHLTAKITDEMNVNEKYTYCLNKNSIIFTETININNNSSIKNYMSKHVIMCNTLSCASGEMVIRNDTFIFDNNSGTYKPTFNNLQSITNAMPFLRHKIIDILNPLHEKYFSI